MDTKTIAGVTSFSTIIIAVLVYLRVHQKLKKKNGNIERRAERNTFHITEDDVWNTVIFFPDYFPEKEDSKTRQLIWYLEQAVSTIEVCLYGFSFKMLEEALIYQAKENKVEVKVLTNRCVPGNRRLRQAGIQTRAKRHLWKSKHDPKTYLDLMHHKFVLIDRTAVLGGSLNWTWAVRNMVSYDNPHILECVSITENWENVVITNNPKIVSKLADEFDRQWEEARPKEREDKTKIKTKRKIKGRDVEE